jgi:type I restriction enzyme R subunit
MERKALYSRILKEFKDIIHQFEDDTGSLGIKEDSGEYQKATLDDLSHRIRDVEVFFTDEIKNNRNIKELARFSICLDEPYELAVKDLSAYPIASELIGRGVVSETILTKYLSLTSEFSKTLNDYDIDLKALENLDEGSLFWSLTECREGSTIIDFALNAYGYTLTIGGPIIAFLTLYKGAAEGLEALKADIQKRFSSEKCKSSMTISKDLTAEMKRDSDTLH